MIYNVLHWNPHQSKSSQYEPILFVLSWLYNNHSKCRCWLLSLLMPTSLSWPGRRCSPPPRPRRPPPRSTSTIWSRRRWGLVQLAILLTLLLLDHLWDLLGDLPEDLGPVLIGHLGVPSPHLLLRLDHKSASVCVCLFLFDGGGRPHFLKWA